MEKEYIKIIEYMIDRSVIKKCIDENREISKEDVENDIQKTLKINKIECKTKLDENGNRICVEERKTVHEKGLWHVHVGVWIMNQKGELLLQQRSGAKKVNPYKWTRTGGHVDSGEEPIEGIQREVEEARKNKDENYTFPFWKEGKFEKTLDFLKSKRQSIKNN